MTLAPAGPVAADGTKIVDVVCAVIVAPDGRFLLGQRPAGKVYAGYWEFPGGKVEPGESLAAATARELHEELGIDVVTQYPWITRDYVYPHATVRLWFRRVVAWRGEPRSRESQALAWQRLDAIDVAPLLPANGPVLRSLGLPPVYAVSDAGELGRDAFLQRLEQALSRGTKLVQLREKALGADALESLGREVRALTRRYGCRLLVNGDTALARAIDADGVHLSARQVAALAVRPDGFDLCAASCHDAGEIAAAVRLGVDFIVLGSVLPTRSHPDAVPMGWERFRRLAEGCPVPVYAIGGLSPTNAVEAMTAGAHGIAMQRGAW